MHRATTRAGLVLLSTWLTSVTTGAAQTPQSPEPVPPPAPRAAPPLRGPFAQLVPEEIAKRFTCTETPVPPDSQHLERGPRLQCIGSAPSWVPAEPMLAIATLKADGEVIQVIVQWRITPAPGEDSVRSAALDSAYASRRAVLLQRHGPGTPCKTALVWTSDYGAIAFVPPRRNAPRAGGPLRGNATIPGYGTLSLHALRGLILDCR